MTGHWEFFPRCFAIGTKQRKYTTMTCESWGYEHNQEQMPVDYEVNKHDKERLEMKAWEPLAFLVKPLTAGPVAVQSRGKEIILAAGFVSDLAILH